MKHFIKLVFTLLIVAVCTVGKSFAQSFCSTPSSDPNLLQTIPPSQFKMAASSYVVRIFIHIIRKSDGTGGQTSQEVETALNTLRSDYQAHNICFELSGVDEIKNDNYYIGFTTTKFSQLILVNSHTNAIDIYLLGNNTTWDTGSGAGRASGIPGTALVIGGNAFGINLASSHVLSHEMGHCLGLYHTFHGTALCGELSGSCPELVNGSNSTTCGDFVSDTPADPTRFNVDQGTCLWNGGHTCTASSTDANGATYTPNPNLLMAYVPPSCMQYHTPGQKTRMFDIIANSTLLQQTLSTATAQADLYMKDTPSDFGIESNPSTEPMWISDDIWVRRTQGTNQTHESPIYEVINSVQTPNYIYVKVRNKGCSSSLGTEKLRVYWAKASTGLSWDAQWVNYTPTASELATFGDGTCTQQKYGDEITTSGGITIPAIAAGGEAIIEIPWYPQSPANYACFNGDQTHFCLLARIETATTPPYGMTTAETTDINANVKNNNNIVWKNVQVTQATFKMGGGADYQRYNNNALIVRAPANTNTQTKTIIGFSVPQAERANSFLTQGTVIIDLGKTVYNKWIAGGSIGAGIETCKGKGCAQYPYGIRVLAPDAYISNMTFAANEMQSIGVQFNYNSPPTKKNIQGIFNYDVTQSSVTNGVETLIGGVRYNIHPDCPLVADITSVTAISCNGGSNGAINLTVTNGKTPYTYSWSNGATTEDLSNLTAGTYLATVTDDKGCSAMAKTNITEPPLLIATAVATMITCNGSNNGSIDLTVIGGTSPYTYSWSNGVTTEDLSNLTTGTYTVVVIDANGCTATANATITEPILLTASASSTNVSCNGGNNGSATLTTSGGTTPYTYSWSNGATTEDLSNLTAGTYSITVTDANGCTATANATITEPTLLTATATSTNVSCNGSNNGSINLTVTGGTTPYIYSWSNGAITEDLSNLTVGSYNITVTDANGCTATSSVTITQPDILQLILSSTNSTCGNSGDGTIDLTVTGGIASYTYSWSNGSTTEDLNSLVPGTYTVMVTDANGCSITGNAIVLPTVVPLGDDNWSNNYGNGGMNRAVWSIAMRGNDVYVGGDFTKAGGITAQTVAKWDAGLSSWTDRAIMPDYYFVDEIALTLSATNNYIGGFFWAGPDMTITSLADWRGGANFNLVGEELYYGWYGPYIYGMAVSPNDEALYVGGGIDGTYSVALNNIGKYKASEGWTPLTGTTGVAGVNGFVYDIAVSANETVYAGGNFTTAGGVAANYIAKWNSVSKWTALGSANALQGGGVRAIVINGNDVYAGGLFTSVNGNANASHIAKWNSITNTWTALGSGINGSVYTIAVAANGDVYAGGLFTIAGGVAAKNIAKWNGTNWEAIGSGANAAVQTIAINGSDLFAGGNFTMAGGKVNNYFAHLTTDPCPVNNSLRMAANTVDATQENIQSQNELSHSPSMHINTEESKIIYYPNPAKYELTVMVNDETIEGNYEVIITDLLGQRVISKHFNGKTVLDVSGIRPTGLYFMQVLKENGTQISIEKLVIEE